MNGANFQQGLAKIALEISLEANEDKPLTGNALILVDVQNDFFPGGALAVQHGDEIIPFLNRYIATFAKNNWPIFATRDWHPVNHCSFKEQGGPWPVHCVVGTLGAAFSPAIQLPDSAIIISKPSDPQRETYSGFEGTNLESQLREKGVRRLYIGGLATDYCVLHTVKAALERGFEVLLLLDAIRAVNVQPEDGPNAENEMIRLGAIPFRSEKVAA